MSSLINTEQLADAYEDGYLQGKLDSHEDRAEQTFLYKHGLEMLIEIAMKRKEYESMTYARQLLRRIK